LNRWAKSIIGLDWRVKEAKILSDLSDETIDLYKREIPNCEVVEFMHSGHMIPDEEQQKYLLQIDSFIRKMKIG
jgi:pimeloyl-ACP methyl ester carboxylesterase